MNKNLNNNAISLPKGMSVKEFKQTLESVENKERFLEHLQTRENSDERLAALNLVEPTLREPHIEIFTKDKNSAIDKKEYIKAFKDEHQARLYMLITQDNDTILRTFIPDTPERYVRNHVRNADITHSFIQPNRTAKSDDALSTVVVYGENTTKKPLTSQGNLLKNQENQLKNQEPLSPLEQASAEKLAKLEHAITPLKEFGTNYPEFALKPKEALEKLLQEKNGQVALAAYREDLGGIDFVWGTPKTKDSNGYGLAHILEKREKQYQKLGLNAEQIKERTDELVKSIPEVIENGTLLKDDSGRVGVELNNIRVGLQNTWYDKSLNNHFVVTGYERDEKVLRELETLSPLSNDYKGNSNYSALNLNENNSTKESLTSQEDLLKTQERALKTQEPLSPLEQAKERTNELLKQIPEVIEKGIKDDDYIGHATIRYNDIEVGLSNQKGNTPLKNHYMITSFERDEKVLRELETIAPLSNDYRDGINYSISNLESNLIQKPLTSQEDLLKIQENTQTLSPLELANAEKLAKLESEQLESQKEFLRLKEQEKERKAALKKKLEHERGNAGNIESQTKIEVGEDIPTQSQAQIPKSRVRLNEREIYDLDYAIVKAKDLKPSFTTGGTQKRTDMNEEQIKSIAQNFDPKKIFGSGGFEDLPIILHDAQVIAGNHRIQGMLNFTPKSRFIYEKAIKEYYHIDLKPDELLVRVSSKRLKTFEINNLAASSNQGRFNSESDHAIAVLSHYEAKLKELETQLNADSVYSLKNIVAKNLNFDKATHPNVGDSNLSLLMYNMPRTKTQGIELLNRWQKEFSNDIKSYEKVKKMFVDNAGSFHNLIHDMSFPNVSLNAYLSDMMDRSFANLKNYQSTSESLKDLSEKFYKTHSLEMFEKSDQNIRDISEILGGAIARFARFDDPSKALFEALKSDNIKKGLKEFKIADVTKDMFNPSSKEFKDIDIYDFMHYLLMVNREPNENNPTLKRLIEAIKDMQKENEKLKEVSQKSAEKTEKGIKRDYSDTDLSNDGIKELLNSAKIPTSGRDAVIFGKNNLTPEIVEFLHKNNKKMIIEKAYNKELELLKNANFRHPEDIRASLEHGAITHILKRHGVNSVNVRNGESPITYQDIANYRSFIDGADDIFVDNNHLIAFKQINGYAVVVEQAVNRKNELVLKTMYKSNGDYRL
nr:DUF3519 domain-containing protein [Helicobacter pylori]